jgi:2-methylisocitrate lyase-like PEP mutase family enzyme
MTDSGSCAELRRRPHAHQVTPFVGIYDVFSASIAARHFDGLFVSGFGFAASSYGLPDVGFVAWPDIVSFVERLRRCCKTGFMMAAPPSTFGSR